MDETIYVIFKVQFDFKLEVWFSIYCFMYLPLFVGALCWSMFWCTLLCVLVLQSSWQEREIWLLCFYSLSDALFLLMLCGSSSRCRGLACSL